VAEPRATPPGGRQALWLWALAAIVLIGIGILIAVRAFGDDSSGTPPATGTSPRLTGTDAAPTAPGITESTPVTTPGGPEPDPPAPLPSGKSRREGTLLVNGNDLYPFLSGNLLRVAKTQVEGNSVPVLEVVSDRSFWVGRSKAQRLLVVLNLKGAPPPEVTPGQKVQFVGQIVDSAGGDHGVTDDEGLQLLRRQGHHASVSAFDLKLVEPATHSPPPVDPEHISLRVRPGKRVSLLDRPGGKVIERIGDTTEFGSPELLSPTGASREAWLEVGHTSLGNEGVGWVNFSRAPVSVRTRTVKLEVDLSRREVVVRHEDAGPRRVSVAVGAPDTPTPPGKYYVTDKLRGADFGPYYGCCILALSGHQPNLPQGWSGGDRLAIHGSPTPTWGQNVSNGCLHAREADLRYLLKTVPLGTVVSVHP
jgi:hypothetical protein